MRAAAGFADCMYAGLHLWREIFKHMHGAPVSFSRRQLTSLLNELLRAMLRCPAKEAFGSSVHRDKRRHLFYEGETAPQPQH